MSAAVHSKAEAVQAAANSPRAPYAQARPFVASVDDPHYYLHNFETVVTWVIERYADLLTVEEVALLQQFFSVSLASRALLVRMGFAKEIVT